MTFGEAISICLNKYADFNGRASRAEYWWFALFYGLVIFGTALVSETLSNLFWIALILPALSVGARRMHDIDNSGWWQIVPLIGFIFSLTEGTDGPNSFGEKPAK